MGAVYQPFFTGALTIIDTAHACTAYLDESRRRFYHSPPYIVRRWPNTNFSAVVSSPFSFADAQDDGHINATAIILLSLGAASGHFMGLQVGRYAFTRACLLEKLQPAYSGGLYGRLRH